MFVSGAVTDAITHFIGLFKLVELQERLRLDFDELTAGKNEIATGPISSLVHEIQHPYVAPDISVQVRHMAPGQPPETVENGATPSFAPFQMRPLDSILPHWNLPPQQLVAPDPAFPMARIELVIPPPGSAAVVIVQHATLYDIDHLAIDQMDYVLSAEALDAQLDALMLMAESAGIAVPSALPDGADGFMGLALGMAQALADAPSGGFTFTGADAHGAYLNGEAGAERPKPAEVLPQDWLDRAEREENGADGPTHDIVHGANMLVNEVVLTASWISAPVLVVGGDSISIDLISQVNVWQDSDTILGLANGSWTCAPGATTAMNFATLSHAPFALPTPAEGENGAPAFWSVVTIEGSLINFNWIEQLNFVSDGDVTSITLMGASTTMILGANQSVNAVSLFELGWEFDIIIVDGCLINLAAIFQTNLLLDSDHVTLRDGGGQISTGDNLLLNDASILQVGQGNHLAAAGGYLDLLANPGKLSAEVLNDPAFAGLEGLRVLHIKGDLVTAQIIEQINVLGDADQVDLLAARAMENAGDVAVVTGSNALINSAHIAEYGIDSKIHTAGNVYSDALIHQAELVDTATPYTSPGLATEAVVFLADGMSGTAVAGDDIGAARTSDIDATSIDPMQTVLA